MTVINIDGQRVRVEPPPLDLDGDGIAEDVESVGSHQGITHIQQGTELGETTAMLFKDEIDANTRQSKIDMLSNLHKAQVNPVTALEACVSLHVCPTAALAFTRQIKRNAISIEAKGRNDVRDMTIGKREQDVNKGTGGIMGGIKSLFQQKAG